MTTGLIGHADDGCRIASFLIGGVANSVPPSNAQQATQAIVPTITTTTLTTNQASPVAQGTPVMLTATVTPATAVGAVQFIDGTAPFGNPIPVTNGTAVGTTTLPTGSHSLTAMFVPTDSTAFSSSTSGPPVALVVGAADTNTTLIMMPASEAAAGDLVTLNAMVTPATAVGTVQFRDGTVPLGDPRPVTNGVATGSTTRLRPGSHALNAVFIPANRNAFNPSMSGVSSFTVTRSDAVSLAVSLDSQESVLSLDLGTSLLDDQAPAHDGRLVTLDGRQSTLDDCRTLLDDWVSALDNGRLLRSRVWTGLG